MYEEFGEFVYLYLFSLWVDVISTDTYKEAWAEIRKAWYTSTENVPNNMKHSHTWKSEFQYLKMKA
jgi:hypothetical protein